MLIVALADASSPRTASAAQAWRSSSAYRAGALLGFPGHQDGKFLAAVPCHQHLSSLGEGAQHPRDCDKHLVSELMPELVVDRFEAIDVAHQNGGRQVRLRALAKADLAASSKPLRLSNPVN
jgi:hypothetical protein